MMRASEAAVTAIADVAQSLRTDWSRGLDATEAEQRRQLHGLNEFNIKEEDPLWRKYLNQVRRSSCGKAGWKEIWIMWALFRITMYFVLCVVQ